MDRSQWPRFCRTDWRTVCLLAALVICGLTALIGYAIGYFDECVYIMCAEVMVLMAASVVLESIRGAMILRFLKRSADGLADNEKEESHEQDRSPIH